MGGRIGTFQHRGCGEVTSGEQPVMPDPVPHSDVPPEVIAQAKDCFPSEQRPLAVLVFDSLVDAGSRPESHQLRFEHERLTIWVEVSYGPDGAHLAVRTDPPAQGAELQRRDGGTVMVTGSDAGHVRFKPVPPGLVKLCATGTEAGFAICTEWFRV